jgi:FdhD protein
MRGHQPAFDSTGGLHAAAVFASDGTLLVVREDIGRHNAVDKVIGALASTSWPIGERILLVSGRVSFEIVQKAAVAGIPFVAGISAVSSLAVDLAEELELTVVGFLRGNSFNAYSGAGRIV